MIFGYLQFMEPLFPKGKFWESELILFILSVILGIVWKIFFNKYEFTDSKNQKLCLKIAYGDIFKKKYDEKIRVIPVDEDLTENIDNRLSSTSIQAKFMTEGAIKSDLLSELRTKSERILRHNKYYLLRVAKCTESGQIHFESYRDYFEMIYELCKAMDAATGDKKFVCPVIGGSIRFKNDISSMQRLQLMKLAIESYGFKQKVEIDIVVKRDWKRPYKYSLRDL